MSNFSQVEKYVAAAKGAGADGGAREVELQGGARAGAAPGGTGQAQEGREYGARQRERGRERGVTEGSPTNLRGRVGAGYRVLILAAAADIELCIRGNQVRRHSGHVVTHRQVRAQENSIYIGEYDLPRKCCSPHAVTHQQV
jgi:hypothetical protein